MDSRKLTKKQKKGIAYRQSKGKGKTNEALDVPEPDAVLDDPQPPAAAPEQPANETEIKPLKKRKRGDLGEEQTAPVDDSAPRKKAKATKDAKSRFILFVGNLKYTTSKEAIEAHFAICDPPPTVRLLTPKAGQSTKSKGCAFLEFSHRNALQQALKLHHSELEGRTINVELTAGGGGKGESRVSKLKERNKQLSAQRAKREQKLPKSSADEEISQPQEKKLRHSSTSGAETAHTKAKTWSMGDGDADNGKKHRGGSKARKGKTRPSRPLGTGVNAIPVG